ncbi:helix-turn-helix transcriptional regulator [Kribbella albertanoniae]|uniref:helix-turn-helix transcriptional regulator n=1 Tax=Kribbella albertanoniae TaxID=1266829 RepID=UPI00140459D4|nr:helix-turn-helix transcriptional regulator [Kribbella albertanoniae]
MRSARRRELGEFLRERRGRLTPPDSEEPRRTPGLRRAELADLAGVSVGYYTRLEQGRAPHPSDSVLEALIRALGLTDDESNHLRALAADTETPALEVQTVSESALRTMNFLVVPTAAVVLGRIGEVLAWNDAAAFLFPGRFSADRPHNARYAFSPAARELYLDWDEVADDVVAHLRAAAGHMVDDPEYGVLVEELLAIPEFAERWPRRDVRRHVSGERRLKHPVLGELTVRHEVLAVLDTPDQYLVLYGLENPLPGDVEISGAVSTS